LFAANAWSGNDSELPALLSRDQEISLAESAGPASITKDATIYVLERASGYTIARKGANGFVCFVHRDRPDTLEPECFDPEGVESLFPPEFDKAKFREEGMTEEEAVRKIDAGFASGTYRVPRRNAVTYMLSTKNHVFNGEKVISYPPHIMISAPYLKNSDIGADFHDPSMPWVLNEGSPHAYIIVVVRDAATNRIEEHKR
jgi:hypothetical protein